MEMSPCKGCTDRHTACHGSCDRYKEWVDRYHAEQKHYDDHKSRFCIPRTASRDKACRRELRFGAYGHKYGGNQ